MTDNPISQITGLPCTDEEMDELTDIEFAIERVRWHDGVNIHARGINRNLHWSDRYLAVGFKSVKYEAPVYDHDPLMKLSLVSAQGLMNELWKCGIRPGDDNLPSPAAFDATKGHLEDMRKIAFKFLFGEEEEND